MAITVKIGTATESVVVLELDVRKSANGDLMIFDHGDIDIVLSPQKNKIIAFPKDVMNDLVYGAQNRLFAHLHKRVSSFLNRSKPAPFMVPLKDKWRPPRMKP